MKPKSILLYLYFVITILVSCKKDIDNGTSVNTTSSPVNYVNNKRAAISKEVATVLEQVYRNVDACREVNAAIYSEYYEDERVLLKDLLFPENSMLYSSPKFKKYKVRAGEFKKYFCEIIERGSYPHLKEQLEGKIKKQVPIPGTIISEVRILSDSISEILSDEKGIAIYFPYSENFVGTALNESSGPYTKIAIVKMPVLVPTDRDADAGLGREPYYCPGGLNNLCYRDIIVNDELAERRPTHIVSFGAQVKDAGFAAPPDYVTVSRVYLGWTRLTKQMDRLISLTGNGGGSEIKVARISGYLKFIDQQVSNFSGDLMTVYFKRADIRKKKWKRVFGVWDPNWESDNFEQVYAVYEDDTQGTKTFSGSLSTTANLPGKTPTGKGQAEVSFKVEVMTQDEIVCQRKQDRYSFFRNGLTNQGWGFIPDPLDFLAYGQDWPVYDGGTVWQYTFPYKLN